MWDRENSKNRMSPDFDSSCPKKNLGGKKEKNGPRSLGVSPGRLAAVALRHVAEKAPGAEAKRVVSL